MRFLLAGLLLFWTGPVWAEGPEQSLRPVVRIGTVLVVAQPTATVPAQRQAATGLVVSRRPVLRPKAVVRRGQAVQAARRKGMVCGIEAIQGERIGRVNGRLRGCGLQDAVRVRSVSGVRLSQNAIMDCGTAAALNSWVDGAAKPVFSKYGGGLKSLRVAAHYACRTRNSRKGAKISEHGKGRAIDISAFGFHNGSEVSVLRGWNAKPAGQALRVLHRAACGPFGTVLGPDADKYHRDHFHFDTARYRSGSYCR